MNITILGSGISGISCAYHLKQYGIDAVIYEKNNDWGGLCSNFEINGFRFDKFVHFTFTKDEYIKKMFEESSECISHKPESSNYYKGVWLRHPAQNNLFPLNVEEKIKIIKDFINKEDKEISLIKNYEEWLRVQYGNYFAENFPMKYTKKYWTVEAKDLETKWVGNRMHKSSIEEVLRGAMEINDSNDYYTAEMRYPKKGGYKSILNKMVEEIKVNLNSEVINIDTDNKFINFKNGSQKKYSKLISSIPLIEIINYIDNVPIDVKEAAGKLLCTSGYLVSIGFNKPDIPKKLWFYIYDGDISISRVYSPSLKSPDNVPQGYSSIQAEIYFSNNYKIEMSQEEILEKTIDNLINMQVCKREDIVLKDIRVEKYANVVFNSDIYKNRKIVIDFLNKLGIESIGRFGEWGYLWSDQSFLSGKRVADKIAKTE